MPGKRYDIEEFPEGKELWLVKWIDDFRSPHLSTESTSVGVVLQQLAAKDYTELNSLRSNQLSHILGRKRDAGMPTFKIPRVMVGSLPSLEIGQIYQDRIKIGQLPTSMAGIAFHQAVSTYSNEFEMGQEVPAPPWWNKEYKHKILNPSDYIGLYGTMLNSRCDVIKRRDGIHLNEYIIPKTVIFKAFYGMHTEIIKAFCNGPWSKTYESVICMHDFDSGLKTESVNDGRQWNIILQTLVPDPMRFPLALLYFDDYAKRCAETIYTRRQQDTRGKPNASWYASATIPYYPKYEPFRMNVKCFPLPLRKMTDDDASEYEVRRFLVTSIVGSSWPSHLPHIGYERRNSGATSGNKIIDTGKPPPYVMKPEDDKGSTSTTIAATADANASAAAQTLQGGDWDWLNQPKSSKLPKNSSKRYEGERPVKKGTEGKVSTGEHNHKKDGLGKGEVTTLTRAPEKRFEQIIEAMEVLKAENLISSFREISPNRAWQQQSRGGRPCWSFIAEETAKLGKKTGRSWRIVDYGPDDARNIVYRCALVLELKIGDNLHYWIEVECRKGKQQGFRSPLLSNVVTDVQGTIASAIETIAIEKGINLEENLRLTFDGTNIEIDSYKHHYPSKDHSNLGIASVRQFLTGR